MKSKKLYKKIDKYLCNKDDIVFSYSGIYILFEKNYEGNHEKIVTKY